MTDHEKKPVLDEQTFERLLEAAYVLQEHNRKMRELEKSVESQSERLRQQESANQVPLEQSNVKSEKTSRSDSDYTLTLAEIVEAQRQIQTHHLELEKALAVVAETVAKITGGTGAAIGILEGTTVHYRAGAGAPALPLGSEAPLETAVCAASLRTGQVIRCEDVNLEFLFDPELCRHRGIVSLVAVPIYREGDIIGALELYFDKTHGFAEQDIHTCQLMAGLVTEAIGRDAQVTLKKSIAAERSTMLAAIERLQPSLAAWAEDAPAATASPSGSAPSAAKSLCSKCGGKLLTEEQFCGKCGAPRAAEDGASSVISDLTSAWRMQPADQDPVAAMLLGRSLTATAKDMTSPASGHTPEPEAELEESSAGDHLSDAVVLAGLGDEESIPRTITGSERERGCDGGIPATRIAARRKPRTGPFEFAGKTPGGCGLELRGKSAGLSGIAICDPDSQCLEPLLAFPPRRFLSCDRSHSGAGCDSVGNLVQPFGGRHGPRNDRFREREPGETARPRCRSVHVR